MSTTKKSRPGVMFYFSWLETFEELSPFDTKLLLIAILHYAKGGQVPEFKKNYLRAMWKSISALIDADEARYEQKVNQRTAAANARWSKKKEPATEESTMDQYMNW